MKTKIEKLKIYRRNLLNQMEQIKGALMILEELITEEDVLIGDSPDDVDRCMDCVDGGLVPND